MATGFCVTILEGGGMVVDEIVDDFEMELQETRVSATAAQS